MAASCAPRRASGRRRRRSRLDGFTPGKHTERSRRRAFPCEQWFTEGHTRCGSRTRTYPPIEHPNNAIVRVTMAAICGSDLHLYHGIMPDTRIGMTFGHEFIGVVEEVGPSVQSLAKRGDQGDGAVQRLLRIVLFLHPWPLLQLPQRESERHSGGRHLRLLPFFFTPAAATTAGRPNSCGSRSPMSGRRSLPDWMDDEDALLCTDALATGYFGAQLRRYRRRRHGRGVRRRTRRTVRREVSVADGSGPSTS